MVAASLLSQALRMNRCVSLSTLLDVGITDMDQLVSAAAAVSGQMTAAAAAAAAFPPTPATVADAGGVDVGADGESHASAKRASKKGLPQWKKKQHVIEAINELIDELDNIQGSITVQGVEHIHANEVGDMYGSMGGMHVRTKPVIVRLVKNF